MYGEKRLSCLRMARFAFLNPSTKPILPIIFTESLEMKSRKAMESRPILEASSWCPMASIGDVFESAKFSITITD